MTPQQNSAPGQRIDIGGFCLHALVQGEGAPTVVLEPGLGGFALQFAHIQPAVAAFTRVVAYDRAGQAWSDPSPNPRTPIFMVGELKMLLERLDLQPPYVLVGHSFGGLLARIYAGFRTEEVAGLVLIDSSDVQQYEAFPNIDKMIGQMAVGVRLLKFLSRLGLARPLTRLSLGSMAKTLPREDLESFIAIASQPQHQEAALAEYTQHRSFFGPQSEVPPAAGDTPLVVITAGNSISGKQKVGGLTGDQLNERHQQWQKELAQISSRGEHIMIPGATHLSILIQPEYVAQVVDAIWRMVEVARKDSQPPFANLEA
jgi:pimeloyl-ACP methyl ester carboxylesterase